MPEDIVKLATFRAEFIPLYKAIAEFRKHPEEVIGMFSEALHIMDRNTTIYMFEEQQRQLQEQSAKIASQNAKIASQSAELAQKDKENAELKALLAAHGIKTDK